MGAPCLAVPLPGGSSLPEGPGEMSQSLISCALGLRPTPVYLPDCAAPLTAHNIRQAASQLNEAILNAPVGVDLPRLNRVKQIDRIPRFLPPRRRHAPDFAQLNERRLRLPAIVFAAR